MSNALVPAGGDRASALGRGAGPGSDAADGGADAPAPPPRSGGLSRADKAAAVIAALGPEFAAEFLGGLNDGAVRVFARSITRLRQIPPEALDAAIADFVAQLEGDRPLRGGADAARRLLGSALDKNSVDQIMEDIEGPAQTVWDQVSAAPAPALAAYLGGEHPQTVAVVLARIRTEQAARVLERLDPLLARAVVLRLGRTPKLDADTLGLLAAAVETAFVSVQRRERAARKPADLLAGLMNNLAAPARERFLGEIEAEDPRLALEVQKVMFTFADISARLEPRDVSTVLRGVDDATLLAALRHGMEQDRQVVDFLLGNISKRLAERLREDLETMPEVRPRDGEKAQAALVRGIQEFVKSGEIRLIEHAEEDEEGDLL